MEFLPADYVVGGLVIVMAVLGLFRGVSGTLAFFVAAACAVVTASFGWPFSESFTPVLWQRGAATLVATLLSFGIVRCVVRKLVNGLLAQPTDAILGCLLGAAMGSLVIVGWAQSGYHLEYSNLATRVAEAMGAEAGSSQISNQNNEEQQ